MRTLHVIGIDLQERLGVDLGCRGKDDVGVVLLGIGLLRSRSYIHMSVEHRRGLIVNNPLEAGITGAMRHVMVDLQVILDVLFLIHQIEAIHLGFATFAIDIDFDMVTEVAGIEADHHEMHPAITSLMDVEMRLQSCRFIEVLDAVHLQRGILFDHDVAMLLIGLKMLHVVREDNLAILPAFDDDIVFKKFHRRMHYRFISLIHSYPFSSSSIARCLPPDLTMRPSYITCTKSGTM